MSKLESVVIGKMPSTGPVNIDVDKVVSMWNHLWFIAEWRNPDNGNFRLIKYMRKDSGICAKITISDKHAQELIEKAGLTEIDEPMLRSAFGWKRQKDIDALHEWRMEKHKKLN